MRYCILNPTGNITAIVTDPVPAEDYPSIAAKVMEIEPTAEQVGFLLPGDEEYDAKLSMAGGEFCGNASMSAAALTAMQRKIKPGDELTVTLKVSGNENSVPVRLRALSLDSFEGRVAMPKALDITTVALNDTDAFPLVVMEGIVHAVVPESFGIENAEKVLPELCRKLSADAMGMMLVDSDYTRITPVVYVPEAGTLVREHSCASGTASVGAYLAYKEGNCISRSFEEPGGVLKVSTDSDNNIYIEGTVSLTKTGNI